MIAVSALLLIAALVILWRTEAADARYWQEREQYWYDHWARQTERLRELSEKQRR